MALSRDVTRWNPLEGACFCPGGSVVAIGVFDGMHIGHRALFEASRRYAREHGVPAVAITFDQDPDEIFQKDNARFGKLLSNERRLQLIAEQVDGRVFSLPMTREVFSIGPMEFLDALGSAFKPRAIITGANIRFGSRASGGAQDIEQWADEHGSSYIAHDLVEAAGAPVSSTRIRGLLVQGKVSEAQALLAGRPHRITGRVVHGRGEGSDFGFATANLDISKNETMLPLEGVYGAYAYVEGIRYAAAVNVGVSKTFANAEAPIEAHLLDFEGDLYGKSIDVDFIQWLREPRVFSSKEELIATVMGNIEWVRTHLGGELGGANS